MRVRVLAIAVNASAYQVAAAFAGWFGGAALTMGTRSLCLVAAVLTLANMALSWRRRTKYAYDERTTHANKGVSWRS